MIGHFDDSVTCAHVLFPMFSLTQFSEALHEPGELIMERIRAVLKREREELPLSVGMAVHEIENPLRRSTLNQAPADWADSLFARFSAKKILAGDQILGDPCVLSALPESSKPHHVRVDVGEMLQPKAPLSLAGLKP